MGVWGIEIGERTYWCFFLNIPDFEDFGSKTLRNRAPPPQTRVWGVGWGPTLKGVHLGPNRCTWAEIWSGGHFTLYFPNGTFLDWKTVMIYTIEVKIALCLSTGQVGRFRAISQILKYV